MNASVQKIKLRFPSTQAKGRAAVGRPLLPDFYAGPENRLVAFLLSSTEPIVQRGSPLLFHGPSGSGKTTLAASLAMAEAERYEKPRFIQISAVDFARRYAEAVDGDDIRHFRTPLDTADILLVDDIHMIADKAPAQEELANRLEARHENQLATLLTCRRLPTDIRGFRSILASRMLPGLSVAVALPGEETKRQLLEVLAKQSKVDLDKDMLEMLTYGIPANTPANQLAAAVTQIQVWCQSNGTDPDATAVQAAIATTGKQTEPSMQEIANAVARRFKLKTAELKGPTRRQQVVRARALAMFLGRKLTARSLQQIGSFFGGRDHTTVLHACRKTEELLTSSPDLSLVADEVTEALRTSA